MSATLPFRFFALFSEAGGNVTAVATETTHALELMARVETLESVALSLPEGDVRRAQLLELAEKDLAAAAPMRPRVAAELLGLSEKTVRAWVEENVLLRAETSSPRLLLDVQRVHDVLHLINDLRHAGNATGLLDEVYRQLVRASRLESAGPHAWLVPPARMRRPGP